MPGTLRAAVGTPSESRSRPISDKQFTGSLVALVTPMTASGEIDLAAMGKLLDAHCHAGTAGVVVAGTTGESASIGHDEYSSLIRFCVDHSGDRLPVVAGAGAASTAAAINLATQAEAAGARTLLAVTPYYLRTTQAGLIAHYEALLSATDGNIILYNVPGRTGVDLLPETVCRLAEHQRVVGLKEAVDDPERVGQLVDLMDDDFALLSGDDATCETSMRAGFSGVVSVTANLLPGPMAQLCRYSLASSHDHAARLQAALLPIHQLLMAEPNPMPIKSVLAATGKIGHHIRLPLLAADSELTNQVLDAVNQRFESDIICLS